MEALACEHPVLRERHGKVPPPERVAVLEERYQLGLPLFDPDDEALPDGPLHLVTVLISRAVRELEDGNGAGQAYIWLWDVFPARRVGFRELCYLADLNPDLILEKITRHLGRERLDSARMRARQYLKSLPSKRITSL